jgi:hypothetical protein
MVNYHDFEFQNLNLYSKKIKNPLMVNGNIQNFVQWCFN